MLEAVGGLAELCILSGTVPQREAVGVGGRRVLGHVRQGEVQRPNYATGGERSGFVPGPNQPAGAQRPGFGSQGGSYDDQYAASQPGATGGSPAKGDYTQQEYDAQNSGPAAQEAFRPDTASDEQADMAPRRNAAWDQPNED